VKSGKKIAIGGNITDTTHATVRYIPSTSAPSSHQGLCSARKNPLSGSCQPNSSFDSISDGTFAPAIVSQRTSASSRSMTGMPVALEVKSRSQALSLPWAVASSLTDALAAISAALARRAAARHSPHPGQSLHSPSDTGRGCGRNAASSNACRKASRPLPPLAAAPTTGQPSSRSKACKSMEMCFFAASSSRLTHTTTGHAVSKICKTNARFRSRQVASATTSVTLAAPDTR